MESEYPRARGGGVRVVQRLLDGYFGIDADAASFEPLSRTELVEAVDKADAKRVVDLIVVIEHCRHGDDGAAHAERAEEYANLLGVDEPFLIVTRDPLDDVRRDCGIAPR